MKPHETKWHIDWVNLATPHRDHGGRWRKTLAPQCLLTSAFHAASMLPRVLLSVEHGEPCGLYPPWRREHLDTAPRRIKRGTHWYSRSLFRKCWRWDMLGSGCHVLGSSDIGFVLKFMHGRLDWLKKRADEPTVVARVWGRQESKQTSPHSGMSKVALHFCISHVVLLCCHFTTDL